MRCAIFNRHGGRQQTLGSRHVRSSTMVATLVTGAPGSREQLEAVLKPIMWRHDGRSAASLGLALPDRNIQVWGLPNLPAAEVKEGGAVGCPVQGRGRCGVLVWTG